MINAHDLPRHILSRYAAAIRAPRLIPISRAHIDGCLYHGPASLDFARTLAEAGHQVRVPTTLNIGSIDLLHPHLFRGRAELAAVGRELMGHYASMGCRQTFTCAPYQLVERPAFGEQIAWAESNAIVFANSVLGARTERYGDFIDICAAITGEVPETGLHTDEGRLATTLVRVRGVSDAAMRRDTFHAVLGQVVGRLVGSTIPVIDGVTHATEDDLKAFGAAAASSGAVAMFHVVGITPEAATLRDALGGRSPERIIEIGPEQLEAATRELTSTTSTQLGAVSVGTPHFSYTEFVRFRGALAGRSISSGVECFISTGRDTLRRLDDEGWASELRDAGVKIVVDTCTYITPILSARPGVVMTNSAKWAWYAPNNLGYAVVFATLEECVESAVRGEVWRDAGQWEVT